MLQEIGLSVFEAQVVQHLRIRMDVEAEAADGIHAVHRILAGAKAKLEAAE